MTNFDDCFRSTTRAAGSASPTTPRAARPLAQVLHRPDLGVAADRQHRLPQPGRLHQQPAPHLPRALRGRARTTATTSPRPSRPSPPAWCSANANIHERNGTYSLQFINRLEFFCQQQAAGRAPHPAARTTSSRQSDDSRRSVPGDTIDEFNGPSPRRADRPTTRTTRASSRPATAGSSPASGSLRNVALAERRLAAHPPPDRHPGRGLHHRQRRQQPGRRRPRRAAPSPPALPSAWDATHDGRTVLRGSFNQYVDVEVSRIAGHTLGSQVQQRCRWNDATRPTTAECVYSGGLTGATVGLPCGPTGVDADGRPLPAASWRIPKTWEYTARRRARGGRRAWRWASTSSTASSPTSTRRLETNRIWNSSGSRLERDRRLPQRPAPDGLRPRDPRRRRAALPGRHRLGHPPRGPVQAARLVHLEPPRRHGAGRLRQPPTATSPRATSSSTARCPTTTATRSRPTSATASPPGSRPACATPTTRACPTAASTATT